MPRVVNCLHVWDPLIEQFMERVYKFFRRELICNMNWRTQGYTVEELIVKIYNKYVSATFLARAREQLLYNIQKINTRLRKDGDKYFWKPPHDIPDGDLLEFIKAKTLNGEMLYLRDLEESYPCAETYIRKVDRDTQYVRVFKVQEQEIVLFNTDEMKGRSKLVDSIRCSYHHSDTTWTDESVVTRSLQVAGYSCYNTVSF